LELLILCLEVFLARIVDVSLGVVSTMALIKNHVKESTILAFLEIFIWFVVAKQALNTTSSSMLIALFYAGGYATGTYLGASISNKYISSLISVEVISSILTVAKIKKLGYGVTGLNLTNNKQKMFLIEVNNHHLNKLLNSIKALDQNAFVIVNETKFVSNGYIK
jgi:uncharacterized protein YebE (UPF0316 family)